MNAILNSVKIPHDTESGDVAGWAMTIVESTDHVVHSFHTRGSDNPCNKSTSNIALMNMYWLTLIQGYSINRDEVLGSRITTADCIT